MTVVWCPTFLRSTFEGHCCVPGLQHLAIVAFVPSCPFISAVEKHVDWFNIVRECIVFRFVALLKVDLYLTVEGSQGGAVQLRFQTAFRVFWRPVIPSPQL